ncbi:hypothetical protein CGRA01v4_11301 [Colletotrichum graminicola]|nr:hypothetical protein CGRA01v4_11301 [Colletotrichum graminicola]
MLIWQYYSGIYRAMDSESASSSQMGASNRRLRNSCDCCTQLKLKCDQKKPSCNRCIQRRRECVYSQVRKAGRPPKVQKNLRRSSMDILPHQRRKDALFGAPSPHEPAFGSTSPPMNMMVYASPESRTSSPSAIDAMEEEIMGCCDYWTWNWNSFWNFPSYQDGSWLLIYEMHAVDPRIKIPSDTEKPHPRPVSDLDLQHATVNQETPGQLGHLRAQHIDMPTAERTS